MELNYNICIRQIFLRQWHLILNKLPYVTLWNFQKTVVICYKSVVLPESKLTSLIQFFSHYFHTSLELYHRCVYIYIYIYIYWYTNLIFTQYSCKTIRIMEQAWTPESDRSRFAYGIFFMLLNLCKCQLLHLLHADNNISVLYYKWLNV